MTRTTIQPATVLTARRSEIDIDKLRYAASAAAAYSVKQEHNNPKYLESQE